MIVPPVLPPPCDSALPSRPPVTAPTTVPVLRAPRELSFLQTHTLWRCGWASATIGAVAMAKAEHARVAVARSFLRKRYLHGSAADTLGTKPLAKAMVALSAPHVPTASRRGTESPL